MDRAQFMKQLERLLSDISEAEKQEPPVPFLSKDGGIPHKAMY